MCVEGAGAKPQWDSSLIVFETWEQHFPGGIVNPDLIQNVRMEGSSGSLLERAPLEHYH